MTHEIVVRWQGKLAFEAESLGGNLRIDADAQVGGDGNGLRPKALMLDALAGCTGIDIASLMPKMKVNPERFFIKVSGELTEEHPKYYHKVKVEYHFFGKDLDNDKLNKMIQLSADKYCGVMAMFRKFALVELKMQVHPA
jgi:putative redox protein